MTSRRKFLQMGALGMIGMPAMSEGSIKLKKGMPPDTLQLGIAGYTFLHVPMDGAIAMMKRVGVSNLSIKDFYLPLDSTPETIHEVNARFQAAGIRIYGVGVIYMKTAAEVDRA